MFNISLQGKGSIYEQIEHQLIRYIELGVLKPNDKLPSVRQFALELGVNPNTVMKAYQELEEHGYIYTLSKKGAFVAENELPIKQYVLAEFQRIVKEACHANITYEELAQELRKICEE